MLTYLICVLREILRPKLGVQHFVFKVLQIETLAVKVEPKYKKGHAHIRPGHAPACFPSHFDVFWINKGLIEAFVAHRSGVTGVLDMDSSHRCLLLFSCSKLNRGMFNAATPRVLSFKTSRLK